MSIDTSNNFKGAIEICFVAVALIMNAFLPKIEVLQLISNGS